MSDDTLFADRKLNFEKLREAVTKIDGIRGGRRGDLEKLIEKLEVKTIRDGLCHFTRAELFEQLHWKATKFDTVRDVAERLGWITVIRYPQARGGQGANKYQVNWLKIRNDAAKSAIFLPPKRGNRLPQNGNRLPQNGNRLPQNGNRLPQNGNRLPQNGNRVEDARARHPINNPNQNPIYHERAGNGDGNGVYKNSFGGWGNPITKEELKIPQAIERRYREAVKRFRDFIDSEANRLRFFALARDAVTSPNVGNPPAWFTAVLKKGSSPTNEADEWARQAIRQLEHRQPAAMASNVRFKPIDQQQDSEAEKIRKFHEWAGGRSD